MLEPIPPRRRAHFADHVIGTRRFRVARWLAEPTTAHRPLLFFTGLGANIELLAPFLERLRGREVITFDMPGIGGSSASERAYRLSEMASAAQHIVDQLGHDTVDVMGVSWGGMLAQEFAYRQRRRVERLVLAATSPGMPMIPGNLSSLWKMMTSHRYARSGSIDSYLETLYGGSTRGLETYAARIRPPTPAGYLHQLRAIFGWTSLRKLTRVKAETLILMGAEDRLVPPANGLILKFLLDHAELDVLENAGHLFVLTHLGAVAARIEAFLDRPAAKHAPDSAPQTPLLANAS